jgi:tetratricopeptide (TPR) repeat protein
MAAILILAVVALSISTVMIFNSQKRTQTALEIAKMNFQMAQDAVDEMTLLAEERLVSTPGMEQVRRELLEKAEGFYERFLEASGETPELREQTARACLRLGRIYQHLDEQANSEKHFKKAITIFEKLSEDFPEQDIYLGGIATGKNQLGSTLRILGRHEEAKVCYLESIAILEPLTKKYPNNTHYQEVLAKTYDDLGQLYKDSYKWDKARDNAEKAVEIREKLFAGLPGKEKMIELALSYRFLGEILQNISGQEPEGREKAIEAYKKSITLHEELLDRDPGNPNTISGLAYTYMSLAGYQGSNESEELRKRALSMMQELVDKFPTVPFYASELSRAHSGLAQILSNKGQTAEAAEHYRQAIKLLEDLVIQLPESHWYQYCLGERLMQLFEMTADSRDPDLADKAIGHVMLGVKLSPSVTMYRQNLVSYCFSFFAALEQNEMPTERAEERIKESVTLFKKIIDEVPPAAVELSEMLVSRSYIYQDMNLPEKSESDMREATEILNWLATEHPELAKTWDKETEERLKLFESGLPYSSYELCWEYHRNKHYDQAEVLFKKLLEIRQNIYGEENQKTLDSMFGLAITYRDQGRYDESEPILKKVVVTRRRVLGEENPSTLNTTRDLGWLYISQGRYEEAELLYKQILEIQRRTLGQEHPDTLTTKYSLAAMYDRMRKYDQSEVLLIKVLEARELQLGKEHIDTMHAMIHLAWIYYAQGKYDQSDLLYVKALEATRTALGQDHPLTLRALRHVAIRVYGRQGLHEKAEPLYMEALQTQRRVLGEEHKDTISSLNGLAWFWATCPNAEVRDGEKAVEYATKACELTTWENGGYVDTLAAAYAEVGDFTEAVKWQKNAIELFSDEVSEDIRNGLESRLRLYEAGKSYQEER